MSYFKHESAYVDEPCEIGDGTRIWHFCHVQKGARIGRNCVFGQNCNVANDVVIGNNVKVQNNVSNRATYRNGLALTEPAWERVDQEQDIDVLRSLLALTLAKIETLNLSNWLVYLLEHVRLWPLLTGRRHVAESSPQQGIEGSGNPQFGSAGIAKIAPW